MISPIKVDKELLETSSIVQTGIYQITGDVSEYNFDTKTDIDGKGFYFIKNNMGSHELWKVSTACFSRRPELLNRITKSLGELIIFYSYKTHTVSMDEKGLKEPFSIYLEYSCFLREGNVEGLRLVKAYKDRYGGCDILVDNPYDLKGNP